jgi:hypothetical protein
MKMAFWNFVVVEVWRKGSRCESDKANLPPLIYGNDHKQTVIREMKMKMKMKMVKKKISLNWE